MNIGELDNRARIILKGSELSRGKTAATSISSISRSYLFHLRNAGKSLHDLSPVGGRMIQEATQSLAEW